MNSPNIKTLLLISTCIVLLNMKLANSQTVYTWTGLESNNWHNSENWEPAGIPGINDSAILETGATELEMDASIDTIELNGGEIRGPATLSVLSHMDWIDGDLGGSGQTFISDDAVLHISGEGTKNLRSSSLIENHGIIVWDSSFELRGGAQLENSGVIETSSDVQITRGPSSGADLVITNHETGVFRKYDSEGASAIETSILFHNNGIVLVESGTLILTRGLSEGTFSINADAVLRFHGGQEHIIKENASIVGEGAFENIDGGTIQIDGQYDIKDYTFFGGGTAHFNGEVISVGKTLHIDRSRVYFHSDNIIIDNLFLDSWSGTRLGGTATITVMDSLIWRNGRMEDDGITEVDESAVAIFEGTDSKEIHGRILNIRGKSHFKEGSIEVRNNAVINNFGEFTAYADYASSIRRGAGSDFVFNNLEDAVFKVTGQGGIGINRVEFNNHGSLILDDGTNLRMDGGGDFTGSIEAAQNTLLRFNVFETFPIGVYDFKEDLTIEINGTLELDHRFSFHDEIEFNYPTRIGSDARIQLNELLTIVDTLEWDGGRFESGEFIDVAEEGVVMLSGGTLNDGIELTNYGVINIISDGVFRQRSGDIPVIVNSETGIIRKKDGELNMRIRDVFIHNKGLVEVTVGTLEIDGRMPDDNGMYLQTDGLTRLNGGSILSHRATNNTSIRIEGGVVEGVGSIAGDLINEATVRVFAGNDDYGVLSVNGIYQQSSDATLELSIGGRTAGDTYDQLRSDEVVLGGEIELEVNSNFLPMDDDIFSPVTWIPDQREGEFDVVSGRELPDGRMLGVEYTPASLVLLGSHIAEPMELYASISARQHFRPGVRQSYTIYYGNLGTDTVVVTMVITIPSHVSLEAKSEIITDPIIEVEDPEEEQVIRDLPTTFEYNGEIIIPLVKAIPPGRNGSFSMSLEIDECENENCEPTLSKASGFNIDNLSMDKCAGTLLNEILGFLPGGPCIQLASNLVQDGIELYAGRSVSVANAMAGIGLSGARCAGSVIPIGTIANTVLTSLEHINRFNRHVGVVQDCSGVFGPDKNEGEVALELEHKSTCVIAWDPNEKIGVDGFGEPQYTRAREPVPYTIFFENVDTADVPALDVVIIDELDPVKWDLTTFELGSMGFGEWFIEVPGGLTEYHTEVDLRPEMDLLVDIEAVLDIMTGEIIWTFRSLDPETGETPEDPFAGFLPPNVNPPEGDGSVSFTVLPNQDLASGIELINEASIVFDTNEPILTGPWINTIDRTPPVSNIVSLDSLQTETTFNVQWTGVDDYSGIETYSIYVSENHGPFQLWLEDTTSNFAMFEGEESTHYAFFSIARDSVGNTERMKFDPEAETFLIPTSITDEDRSIPVDYELHQNYPNPFNPATTIHFALPEAGEVQLTVYDILGRKVDTLVDGYKDAGYYEAVFDAGHLSSGVYIYQLRAGDFVETKRLLLLK